MILIAVALVVCLWAAAQSTGQAWAMLAALLLVGFALYALRPARARPTPFR